MSRPRARRARSPASPLAPVTALAAALLVANGAGLAAGPLDALPLPPAANSRVVASELVQNGHRVAIATLEPAGSVEETLAFYRELWASAADGEAPGHVEQRLGEWRIISRLDGAHNIVVQLRETVEGVEGFLSAMRLQALPGAAVTKLPLPPGGRLLSTTRAVDIGRVALTWIVGSHLRSGELAGFYHDAFVRDGWTPREIRAAGGPALFLLERRGAQIELVVTDDGRGGSVAVINRVGGDD